MIRMGGFRGGVRYALLSCAMMFISETRLQSQPTGQRGASTADGRLRFEPAPDPGVYTLGPETKWTVAAPRRADGCFLDLDTGKLSDGPHAARMKQPTPGHEVADLKAWAAEEGIDLLAESGTLIGLELVLLPADNRSWDEVPPGTVVAMLKQAEPATPAMHRPPNALPVNLWFRTREGGMGVLQVVGFVENKGDTRGLKMRFRLLQCSHATEQTDEREPE